MIEHLIGSVVSFSIGVGLMYRYSKVKYETGFVDGCNRVLGEWKDWLNETKIREDVE